MVPLTLMAIGAGIGLLRTNMQQQNATKDALLQAQIAKYSPYTGIAPKLGIERPDLLGNVMQGAMAGGLFGLQAQKTPVGTTDVGATVEQVLPGDEQLIEGTPSINYEQFPNVGWNNRLRNLTVAQLMASPRW